MIETFIGMLRRTSSRHRPSQIAWAVALGCACGLLPKLSLLFPLTLALIYLLPIHLPVAAVSILLSSTLSPVLQPLQESAGYWLWHNTSIHNTIAHIDHYPIAPWLMLHNTLVLGALIISAALCLPLAWLTKRWISNWTTIWLVNQSRLDALQMRSQETTETLIGTQQVSHQQRPKLVAPQVEPSPLADSLKATSAPQHIINPNVISDTVDSIHALEDLIQRALEDHSSQLDSDAVLARATRAAELVDEILTAIDQETPQPEPDDSSNLEAMAKNSMLAGPTEPFESASVIQRPVRNHRLDSKQASVASHLKVENKTQPDNLEALPKTDALEIANDGKSVDKPMIVPTAESQVTNQLQPEPDAPQGVRYDLPQTFHSFDTKISISRTVLSGVPVTDRESNSPKSSEAMSISSPIQERSASQPVTIVAPTPPKKTLGAVAAQPSITMAHETATRNVEIRHEEALRHLLSHLRALKEKV